MGSVAAIKAGYHATGKGERRKAREAEGYSHPPPLKAQGGWYSYEYPSTPLLY